jgi:hypothetical protein
MQRYGKFLKKKIYFQINNKNKCLPVLLFCEIMIIFAVEKFYLKNMIKGQNNTSTTTSH